ncbi:YbaB/EbfC family DNA-binding protein [Amycolatopsis sp. NPDC059021]|uniref:YbaB/EbfC family DNA-binding protein n=1 Tax=Amycolatopsis sp. NPDC059021 TaxID=3346704 RepID=UPI00366FAF02
MTTDWNTQDRDVAEAIESAEFNLDAEKRRMQEFEVKSEESTTTRAKDRSLSVSFNGRGELTELKFHGTKYREMPPAQLAHVIVETMTAARVEAITKMSSLMGSELLPNVDFAGLATGKVKVSEIFDELMAPFDIDVSDGVLGRPSEPKRRM